MTTKVKRSLVKSFLNTGTIGSPVWSLVGDGVKTGKIAYNPKTTEETYISQDSASITLDSYAPTMPIDMTAKKGDAAFEFVDALRQARSVLDSAETEIVNVWLYQTGALGYYAAERQAVGIKVDDFGGDGGQAARLNYTIDFIGDPVLGSFDPVNLVFEADPVLAVLDTMVIGAVTLTPLFSANKKWLHYAGSVASSTVTMTSTCIAAGAVVVQKNGVTVIAQAGTATLAMGVNHLHIQVTVGSEVVTYDIDITRTA